MDRGIFKDGMELFCENFNFEASKVYMDLVFKSLEIAGVDEKHFVNAVEKMILTKKKGDFFGRPAVADWLEIIGKKTLTDEQKNVKRASEIMKWLELNIYFNDYVGKWQWDGSKCKHFDDEVINKAIKDNFDGCSELIERYKDQKNSGYTELFRKELVEFMEISEVDVDEALLIGKDDDVVSKLDSCIGNLAIGFKK